MPQLIERFDTDNYEWVRVEALQRFNISKRSWSNNQNLGLDKGESYLLPRKTADGESFAEGMEFYYENSGFLEVVEEEPEEVYSSVDESNVSDEKPEPEDDNQPESEPEAEESSAVEDMSYGELQDWASDQDDVQGNDSREVLENAYLEREAE